MTLFKRRSSRKLSPPGVWLAFLAVGIQFLLPLLVVYELVLASSPAYADTFTICSASSIHSQLPGGADPTHQAPSDHCPICAAVAAGHGVTTPHLVALPLPSVVARDHVIVASAIRATAIDAAPYQSRAPPSLI
jgi:hypothetical protein